MRIPKVFPLLLWLLASSLPSVAQVAPCVITDLEVEVGDCTSDSTFQVDLNFQVQNPTTDTFEVFGNGAFLGTYTLNQLPLTIKDFPAGAGIGSFVRVCLKSTSPNNIPCCGVKQFFGPNCFHAAPCEIYDVNVKVGDCLPTGEYKVLLDFKVKNPAGLMFEVKKGDNTSLGVFPLSSLPVALTLPASATPSEVLIICLKDEPDCCANIQFAVPPCPPPPCHIRNLRVETGACTSDSTYKITLNFSAPSTTPITVIDSFDVYTAGGQYLGRYALSSLPLSLEFPWSGNNVDGLVVCLKNTNCCRKIEFNAPDCIAKPCGIKSIEVGVGECLSPKSYRIKIALHLDPLPAIPFEVNIWAGSGDFLGTFQLGDFPLVLTFPASGEDVDRIKVCLVNPNGVEFCCKIAEFKAPNCDKPPCPISDLKVEVAGPCNPDGTYPIVIDFKYSGPTPAAFVAWAGNGKMLGIFPIGALPVKIAKFPASGNDVDKVRVCLVNANAPTAFNCCLETEFKAPDCQGAPCGITSLKIEVGPCNNDGTYRLVLNFITAASSGQFAVWAGNGQFLGIHPFSALPLTIPNFPASGKDVDVIRICVLGPAGTIVNTCCIEHEFKAPNCPGPCAIKDLEVKVGDCNPDGTFKLGLNFKTVFAGGATKFALWVNGAMFGTYALSDLPLTIPNFPGGNGNKVEIRVCLISPTAPDPSNTCCAALTFVAPNCQGHGCTIEDLSVKVGDCNPDGTYKVQVHFKALTPTPGFFSLWANGQFIGTYPMSALPLTIPNFPASGKDEDAIKVCIVSPNASQPLCCEAIEFDAPDCSGDLCEIDDLEVSIGDCHPDGTYPLKVHFTVNTKPNVPPTPTPIPAFFGVWANGQFLGTYPLSALPLTIPHFPASGKDEDAIKVCLMTVNSTQTFCCAELSFAAPDCSGKPCKIWDTRVQATPCLCGQFFAVLTFRHQNGSAAGFDVIGANGDVYGSFSYAQPQPIILGPFDGDGSTAYVFAVQDKGDPKCAEEVKLGVIDCPDFGPSTPPVAVGQLSLSPNPATQWVTGMAKSATGAAALSQAVVEVRKPDGRLMYTAVVPSAQQFTLNISELPAGLYRLLVTTAEGRYESSFVKQ